MSARERLNAIAARLEGTDAPDVAEIIATHEPDLIHLAPDGISDGQHLYCVQCGVLPTMDALRHVADKVDDALRPEQTDLASMHAALTAVLAEHEPSPGSTEGHGRNGYLGPVCLTCRNADGYPDPWPCDTNLTIEAALQPKEDRS